VVVGFPESTGGKPMEKKFLKQSKGQIDVRIILLGGFAIVAIAVILLGNWGAMNVKVVDTELSNPNILGTCKCTITLLNKGASGYVVLEATIFENNQPIFSQEKITEVSKWSDTKTVEFTFPCKREKSYTAKIEILKMSKK
jgi:hypothetical protein